MGVLWGAQAPIYPPGLSDCKKSKLQKSPIFSEGARVVSVKNSDLGQTAMNLDSVEGDLDCVGPDLLVYEVKNQKKSKPKHVKFSVGGYEVFRLKTRSRSNQQEFDQHCIRFSEGEARSMKPNSGLAKDWTVP